MAKKREESPPPGSPAWMATFSDLMNLLLCFFVLLFSMSTIDEAKLAEIVAAMNSSFSVFDGGASAIGDGMLISNGVSQLNELSEYINSTGAAADSKTDPKDLQQYDNPPEGVKEQLEEILEEQNLKDNEQLAESVAESVSEGQLADQIEVTFTAQYVQLTMKGALLFDSGSAELKTDAEAVLDKVGIILMHYSQGLIEIEGHTDDVPISNSRFADNEELSSARALAVFYYLVDNTALDPANLRHEGMGERAPIADNSTEEGRSRNRRVEIRIRNGSR